MALLLAGAVVLAGPTWAEEGAEVGDLSTLRLRYGLAFRGGGQQDLGPGISYGGVTPNDWALDATYFGSGQLGGALSLQRDGFTLFEQSGKAIGGGLLRASASPGWRWAIGSLRLEALVGYGYAQLPSFGSSLAPSFVPAHRHALMLAGRALLNLPYGLRAELRGEYPLALVVRDGAGQAARAPGFAVGGSLAIGMGNVGRVAWALLADYQLVADWLSLADGTASAQVLSRAGLAIELSWPGLPWAVMDGVGRSAGDGQAGEIAVAVVDGKTAAPVTGARVRVRDVEQLTDSAGRVVLTGVPAGAMAVSVAANGYRTLQEMVLVVEDKTSSLELSLSPEGQKVPATLRGQVRSTDGGTPVSALLEIPQANIKIRAGASGAFSFQLPEGTYTMTISAPGYLSQSKSVTVKEGDEAIFNVDMHPARP